MALLFYDDHVRGGSACLLTFLPTQTDEAMVDGVNIISYKVSLVVIVLHSIN